ncbi:MAG TPA: DAK2 domain-containing protein [Coriobacteriia bacterium]
MTEPTADVRTLITSAAAALKERRDEVNRLNVFPVPDGDTGTNMSLTMDAVLSELAKLPEDATAAAVCHAVTQGSLMGARGNSGVILSQILRGLCADVTDETSYGPAFIAEALARATTVAYQAVRKPAEGTMLTVVKDAAAAAREAADAGSDFGGVLDATVKGSYASVRRGPELLPVLKEAGVVDAGGFGVAILAEGFAAAFAGRAVHTADVVPTAAPTIHLEEPANDWNDTEHLYCTEFLLVGERLDRRSVEEWMASVGGSQLVVGSSDMLKVHVHTDDPAKVLAYATGLGQVAEVHVNNMRLQSQERAAGIAAEQSAAAEPRKPFGFVAVASGEGLERILRSLGVDVVVSGGQTMNPSTAELLEASSRVNADTVVILPDNRNIIMAAQQVPSLADRPVGIVPTTSVPEGFAAMLAFDASASLDDNLAEMSEAASRVRTGEVTTAVKNSRGKAGKIKAGQVIGIADHEIEVVGTDVADVAGRLLDVIADGGETLTVLGGADLTDADLEALAHRLAEAHPELEVESHRGDQPLYPVLLAVE